MKKRAALLLLAVAILLALVGCHAPAVPTEPQPPATPEPAATEEPPAPEPEPQPEPKEVPPPQPDTMPIDAWIAACCGQGQAPNGIDEAVALTQFMVGAYESYRTGQKYTFPSAN